MITTKTDLIALAAAALLSISVGASSAQDFTRPNADIRALEAPVDVTLGQIRAQRFDSPIDQGRSVAVDGRQGQVR